MKVLDHAEGLLAVGRGQQVDAVVLEFLERLLDEQPDVLLVVDDEDTGHRLGSLAVRCERRRCARTALRATTIRHDTPVTSPRIHPMRSLALLSVAHAINHAQAVILPLIFLKIIIDYDVGVETIAFLAAASAVGAGLVQLSYAGLTRIVARRHLLGVGGILFGGGFALQAFATSFATFAIPNIVSRIGGSPQHPVGNGLLSEQFPPERRGFAISAHIAGGNVGTVVVAVIGAPLIAAVGWRGASIALGLPAIASRSSSCCSSARPARTGQPRRPAGPSGRRSAGSPATGTCAGCT